MFLCDKYAPKCINDMIFNCDIMKHLIEMSKDVAIPHIILYGPQGSGKNTIARLLLENIYDTTINNTIDTVYTINGSGNTTSNISIKQSPYHIVIDPNNNNFDKYLIQTIVKTYAMRVPFSNVYKTSKSFKVVVINEIDNLSYYAQMSLRRTMEKYSSTCRFLMICNSISKIIDPLKSRCACIRIPLPTSFDIIKTMMIICYKENINLSLKNLNLIIQRSNCNIKHALWLLECVSKKLNPTNTYIETINEIIAMLLKKDLKECINIRTLLYKILITNISGSSIIQDIMVKLCSIKKISHCTKIKIIKISSEYEHNITIGRREIIHLDGFIMNIILLLISLNNTS